MIVGLSVATFTLLHVLISVVGILSGAAVLASMVAGRPSPGWTETFLATTVATSVTGFMFHATSFGPPEVIGVLSLIVLAVALFALYGRRLAGFWRPVYVVSAILALYLNVFVGVVQAFQKIAVLRSLAPTQSEPPFVIAQAVVLLIFLGLGYLAVRHFRAPEQGRAVV